MNTGRGTTPPAATNGLAAYGISREGHTELLAHAVAIVAVTQAIRITYPSERTAKGYMTPKNDQRTMSLAGTVPTEASVP
jgi:hypothetical protein